LFLVQNDLDFFDVLVDADQDLLLEQVVGVLHQFDLDIKKAILQLKYFSFDLCSLFPPVPVDGSVFKNLLETFEIFLKLADGVQGSSFCFFFPER
jgi:hypothetical protein